MQNKENSVKETLDFTGGPWLLRNGETAIVRRVWTNPNYYLSDKGYKFDENGCCIEGDSDELAPEKDLMENLNNWKHNRKDV